MKKNVYKFLIFIYLFGVGLSYYINKNIVHAIESIGEENRIEIAMSVIISLAWPIIIIFSIVFQIK